jgi:hypothetical protein
MKAVGSRVEVMHGTANHTSGGLKKTNLKMVRGRIVSKAASKAAKKRVKDSPFQKFISLAKKSKGSKKLKLAPKKNSAAYKKVLKK